MHQTDRDGQKGFTLMEIMVAMMILAMSLTVVLQLFSGGLRSGLLSKNYLQAVYHARAKMEEALLVDVAKVVEENQQGEIAEGYSWTTTVQQVQDSTADDSPGVTLFNVAVTLSWQEGEHQKSFSLQSLRLGSVVTEQLFSNE